MSDIELIDTHAHLDMAPFDKDRIQVIARARENGVSTIVTIGTDLDSSRQALRLAEANPGVFATIGCHPHEAARLRQEDLATMRELAQKPKVVAIGEVGLDYYRDLSPREIQRQALRWQLEMASEMGLPVVIHGRQAEAELSRVIGEWAAAHGQEARGVIHCFGGDAEMAHRYLDLGFYISFGAYIGYPSSRNLPSVIRGIPADRIVVETDCPFLPPQAHRGGRNEPAYLPLTVKALAEIRGVPLKTMAEETTGNARRLFRL